MALPSMTIELGVPQKDLNIVGDVDITICVTLESGVELKDTVYTISVGTNDECIVGSSAVTFK